MSSYSGSEADNEELLPENSYDYEEPLVLGNMVIGSAIEFESSKAIIISLLRQGGLSEDDIEMVSEDLGMDGDPDTAMDAIRYIGIAGIVIDASNINLAPMDGICEEHHDLDKILFETGAQSVLQELTEKFSLDMLANTASHDGLTIDEYIPDCPEYAKLSKGLGPPRPPFLRNGNVVIKGMLLSHSLSRQPYKLVRYGKWSEHVDQFLPAGISLGKEEHFGSISERRASVQEVETITTSSLSQLAELYSDETRANMRPKGGVVYLILDGGEMVNVGAHSYRIRNDIEINLDFTQSSLALEEFFSATAGEGLACATPSHELHQMTSAVLAHAINLANPDLKTTMEEQHDDIIVQGLFQLGESMRIDITSTSGLWKKPLAKRHLIALSKYDLGATFLKMDVPRVPNAFAAAIANCLAVEHPAFYGLPQVEAMPLDLQLQYRISNRLHSLSQGTIRELSKMSYEALVAESVREAIGLNPHEQGRTFKEKANILSQGILDLPCPDRIAIPPYPTGPICGMLTENFTMEIGEEGIIIPSMALSSLTASTTFKPPDYKVFLESFPASGLFPFSEAWDWCTQLQAQVVTASGATHRGPEPINKEHFPTEGLWEMTSQLYGQSGIAQFAEVRADLVKAIDTHPMPPDGQWRMQPLLKGKVYGWYASRDSIADPRGYRIDWFAVSAFPVIGGKEFPVSKTQSLYLWPRQRLRSQEMELAGMLPRRLKLTLYSMLEKMKPTGAKLGDVLLAWQKLGLTATSSTWASGANYITCRHLSSSLSSPSPPFDSMVSKLKPAKTLACVLYLCTLNHVLKTWHKRDQYHDRAALLGLPRAYSQLESYWQVWVPDELADPNKHMTDCAIALWEESVLLDSTFHMRYADLQSQMSLLSQDRITVTEIRASIDASCHLDTGGKLGWSVFGSLASAHALGEQGDVANFDRSFSHGTKARRLVDHLTVRHSARIDSRGNLHTGTVAEMILDNGVDDFLSTLLPTLRFFYLRTPLYINHAKNGELKDREISIADPDSRIMLNNAELINGSYGRHTSIDMLKRPDKDSYYYSLSAKALLDGGAIQASDASRFSAMMSNIATGITNLSLACQGGSAHLMSSAAIYRRLASRKMVLSTEMLGEIDKRLRQHRSGKELRQLERFRDWITKMPKIGTDDEWTLKAYCTSVHTGQGMSHHGTSLAHAGALLVSLRAAEVAKIIVSGRTVTVAGVPMVTSDDSTIIAGVDDSQTNWNPSRGERQKACKLFLQVQRRTRLVALRSVSVLQNLPKEKISGIAGEFNSQDNGIGVACPILGFREMICQLVRPSSGSLIGDYLSAYAYGQSTALAGQGLSTGVFAHHMMLDAVEARWRLSEAEKQALKSSPLIPDQLIRGTETETLLSSPGSQLPFKIRQALIQIAHDQALESEQLDPHSQDTVFGAMLHVKISMKKQHKHAITKLREKVRDLSSKGLVHQALMLDQSLMSTLASARNRNIGRIGQRIRTRKVSPMPYLGCEFQKAPILEASLTWLTHLETMLDAMVISPECKEMASLTGATVHCHRIVSLKFPQPITKRRPRRLMLKKPNFVLEPYGLTPFGQHAIVRAGALLVPAIGPEHRALVHNYMAGVNYRKISEHTLYGGKFPISWVNRSAGTLVSTTPSEYIGPSVISNTYWGVMSSDAVEFLREAELLNQGTPVLALNYAVNNVAHFHAVYHHKPISHSITFDPENVPLYSTFPATARGGVAVILAFQGASRSKEWYGTGPTGIEIRSFQQMPAEPYPNSCVEDVSLQIEREGGLDVPVLAAKTVHDGKTTLYISSKKMSRRVPERMLPYERSKMVGTMAMGAYWYTALKGVVFRAFLKGHYGEKTAWTGPVLGWRASRTPVPDYIWEPPEGGGVKYLAMIGGIDKEEDIAGVQNAQFATGSFYVDRTGMHGVDEVVSFEFTPETKGLVQKMNGGGLLFTDILGKAQLIDTMLPEARDNSSELSAENCEARLKDIALGNSSEYDFL